MPKKLKPIGPEKKPEPSAPPPAAPRDEVVLRTPQESYSIPSDLLASLAIYWSYVVRNRRRWAGAEAAFHALTDRAIKKLEELKITSETLKSIASTGVVEVSVPFHEESRGWAGRILPWEFLISAATQPYRSQVLLVVRHLDIQGPACCYQPRDPRNLLFVQSAPGEIGKRYSFESERWLVESSLGLGPPDMLVNPMLGDLSTAVRGKPRDVVHVSAVDLHQGASILGVEVAEPHRRDGVYLAGPGGAPAAVDAWEFASALNPPGAPGPVLVTCNFYNSAARVAALAVARGAGAAIGFQDVIDDALAERFLGNFYSAWRECGWNLLEAFQQAFAGMGAASMKGTGVVLWSARSLVGPGARKVRPRPAAETIKIREEKNKPLPAVGPSDGGERKLLRADPVPFPAINYSVLHNNGSLFQRFTITKLAPGYAHGVRVEVVLHVGSESFPFRASIDIPADQNPAELKDRIKVPLTSRLARSLRENVYTTLYVEVTYQNQEIYRDTHRVTLLPVDEWKFDPNDESRWLASFVLPRDPAVTRIVDSAQKYLMALRDDSGAGFDGYQSTDPEAEDPDEGVDMQVRALWAALSYDLPLSYINPPPSFTEASQRLRTPSDVIQGRRGTCIDLALLLAACLEYVDIYPVIFVLKDHAFPGYWRSEASHEKFLEMQAAGAELPADSEERRLNPYDEVVQLVHNGDLVPLETVWLTQHKGFWEAVDAGIDNLQIGRASCRERV